MSLLIAILWSFHLLSFDSRLLHGRDIFRWSVIHLLAFLFLGLVEEYVFRGYLQFTLTRGFIGIGNLISRPHARTIAFWIASLLTSALFLAAHTRNGGENKAGLLQVFVVGIVFLAALWRTGSLWWPIGFHMAWDWAQSFLYGVPNSGGLMQGRLFATHAIGNTLFSGGTD
jgi:membrane protease YdiL (CAAX protease family)